MAEVGSGEACFVRGWECGEAQEVPGRRQEERIEMERMRRRIGLTCAAALAAGVWAGPGDGGETARSAWARWKNGPPSDPGYYPIAVWLQDPRNAKSYRAAGINLFVGLW